MPRVFLTGASGFVGRRVLATLRDRGHQVTCLGRSAGPGAVAGDLASPESYAAALVGHDVVVHLAAITGKAAPDAYQRINVDGTRLLLDAARRAGVARFLFCSSIAVTFADTRRYHYARSKAAAETLVQDSGLRTAIVRPTIVAGAGSPVMSKLEALAGLPIVPVFGTGEVRLQPIHVDDLADLIVDVVDADRFGGDVFELGGRDIMTVREIMKRLRRLRTPQPPRFVPVPMSLLLAPLALLEPLLGPLLPMTTGQLATFRFDGVARPNPLWAARRDGLASLERTLASASSPSITS